MMDNDQNSINEINFTKRCILMTVISQDKNVVLVNSFHKIPIVKLYTADSSYENFIYTKLKGAFCIFMSKENEPKNIKYFFRIYSLKDYSTLFNMEVKKEYMQYITQYKEDFYFMELRQSFLGFKFLSKDSARIFFLLLNEDPKKEILEQNEGAKNIKQKEISKTLTKVNDYIKARLKYKFENYGNAVVKTIYNNKRKDVSHKKDNNFSTIYVNDNKGIYIDTSMIHDIDLLINNLEIDDNSSNCYLFTEKKLNLEKCKKIIKNLESNSDNITTIKHRNEQTIPLTIIDKDCHTIGNTDLYAEIMTKNIINNIRTQKRLEIFQKEHKKRHRVSGAVASQLYRRTKTRLTKISSGRISNMSKKNEKISLNNFSTEDDKKSSNYMNLTANYNANNSSLKNKKEAKSVDKENSGRFARDRRQINSLLSTEVFKEVDEEDDIGNDKGGFSYFKDSKNNNSNNYKLVRKNNLKLHNDVDIIEEKPDDEDIKIENKKIKNNKKRPSAKNDNSSLSNFLMSQAKDK